MRVPCRIVLLGLLLFAPCPTLAHHGKDFLLVETAELPHPGDVYLIFSFDRIETPDETELEASPSFILGLNRRLAVEVHAHFARGSGDEWRYEAIAPAVRLQLTRPDSPGVWRVGISTGYEIAHERGSPDRAEGRLIFMHKKERSNMSFNLTAEREQGGEGTEWGYALGFRPDLDRRLGWGFEAQGSFEHDGAHEALVGLYGEPAERLTLKLGLGAGLGPQSPDFTARFGLVFRF